MRDGSLDRVGTGAPRSAHPGGNSTEDIGTVRTLQSWWAVPAATAVLLLAACGAAGVRPYLTPLPNAVVDTVPADPADLIREIAALVAAEGLRIAMSSPAEGYLETEWYDAYAQQGGGVNTLDPQRVVLLRFFSDGVGGSRSQLVAEAVIRRAVDPSLPERENELLVPPGHPGEQILLRVLAGVRSRFPVAQP